MNRFCAWRMTAIGLALPVLASCHAVSSNSQLSGTSGSVATEPAADRAGPGIDYKKQREVEAMRGLRYDSGLVTIHRAEAAALVPDPDPDAAYHEYQVGVRELMINNDRHAAIAAFSRAVINEPDQPYLYEGLGRALRAKGKEGPARAAFSTAISLSPDWAEAHYQLGLTQAMFGESDQAVRSWNRAVELDPTHGEAHLRIAVESYYRQEYDTAWAHLRLAGANNAEVPAQFRTLLSNASGRSN